MKDKLETSIITVTLNPAIDSTLYFEDFQVGQVNRVRREIADPGGKGVNVAKVVKALGYEVAVTGLLGKSNAILFHDYFEREHIKNEFIEIGGNTRTNIKIVSEKSGQVSEINFSGLHCLPTDLEKLDLKLKELAKPGSLFVFSGSLPPGAPSDIYREFITYLGKQGCKTFLDTNGPALLQGIEAKPYAIKPNINELNDLTGRTLKDEKDIISVMKGILTSGVSRVVVSLGAEGALAAESQKIWRVLSPRVPVRSTVGAGDAMVGGLVVGEALGWPLSESIRLATAAAAASVARLGTQAGSLPEVEKLQQQVIIEEIR
jgi:1-phosphofructokinase